MYVIPATLPGKFGNDAGVLIKPVDMPLGKAALGKSV